MSKLRRLRVGLLIAVAVLCVCALAYAATPTATYWPLKVGNSWTLHYTGTGMNYSATNTVTKSFVKSSATWYELDLTGAPGGTSTQDLCHNGTGLLCSTSTVATTPSPYYLIKTPLTAGTTWTMTTGPSVIKRTITSVNATIKVPAGTFTKCLEITQTYPAQPNMKVLYWYAPGTGLVCDEIYSGSEVTETAKLTKYTIK
jgi:hypothetical protein